MPKLHKYIVSCLLRMFTWALIILVLVMVSVITIPLHRPH